MKLSKLKSKKFSPAIKISLIVLIILLVVFATYYACDRAGYIRAFQLGMQVQEQEQLMDQDRLAFESLKKIMLLPEDIEPTIATINDIEALKAEQPDVFGKAKNGDRIIIYPTLAIIYDYEANQIIHIGPVSIEAPAEQEAADEAPTE